MEQCAEIAILCVYTSSLIGISIASLIGIRAAYRNGVVDGYGYSREKNNPGYADAGEILKTMSHRWPELSTLSDTRLAINPYTQESRLLTAEDSLPEGWRWF